MMSLSSSAAFDIIIPPGVEEFASTLPAVLVAARAIPNPSRCNSTGDRPTMPPSENNLKCKISSALNVRIWPHRTRRVLVVRRINCRCNGHQIASAWASVMVPVRVAQSSSFRNVGTLSQRHNCARCSWVIAPMSGDLDGFIAAEIIKQKLTPQRLNFPVVLEQTEQACLLSIDDKLGTIKGIAIWFLR